MSTSMALIKLTEGITSALDKNFFIDLEKAFDTLDHSLLLHKLEAYGIRDIAKTLIKRC